MLELLQTKTNSHNSDLVRWVVSNREYPNGTPVFHEVILGKYVNTTIKVDSDSGEIETQETLVAEQGQDQVHIQVLNVHGAFLFLPNNRVPTA